MNVNYSSQDMQIDIKNPKPFKESSIDFGSGGIQENLDGLFVDASINNLTWLKDDSNFVPRSKDNDIKDDLELQYGGDGDIGEFNYQDSPEAKKMPNPEDSTFDIVRKTREFLNKGLSKNEILIIFAKKYGNKITSSFQKIWKSEGFNKTEGIIGKIAVDITGYENPKDALKHASCSPFKKFIKYVIGETRDTEYRVKNSSELYGDITASSGNSTDDFFNNSYSDCKKQVFSKNLMMPVLANSFDLDDSEASDTLIQLSSMGYMSGEDVDLVKKENKTAYSKIKNAFLLIAKNKKEKLANKYKGKVNSSEFKINKFDNPVIVAKENQKNVPVCEVSYPKAEEVVLPKNDQTKVEIKAKEMDIPIAGLEKKPFKDTELKGKELDVELKDPLKSLNFGIKKQKIAFDLNKKKQAPIEIDEQCFKEDEFLGIDAFDFDDVKVKEAPLEIDGSSDFSF